MAFVYILTSQHNKVLYVGSTTNLKKRVYMHKKGFINGFSKRYNAHKLVYFEVLPSIESARERENGLKKTLRRRKIALIDASNPGWIELTPWE